MAIVTISRGSYPGGISVAEKLASELGHPCIGRSEVVRDAAQASGIAESDLLSTMDEPPRYWEKKPGRIPAHLNAIRTALLRRAQTGDLVFHGYVGHLLLRGISHVVRVRVITGTQKRIEALMEDYEMSEKKAAAHLKKLDTQLAKWTQFLYGVDWQDPSLYDVVLNLDRVSVEGGVATIAQMTRLPEFQPTAESRKAFEDLCLSSEVWAALSRDDRTKGANIRVSADAGTVFVTGVAVNYEAVNLIPEVAAAVDGVQKVDNQVGVGKDWSW